MTLPLLPSQAWFFGEIYPVMLNPNRWNLARMYELPADADAKLARQVVTALWRHHDTLRVRFVRTAAGWRQAIADKSAPPPFVTADLSAAPEGGGGVRKLAEDVQSSLHVEAGPLARFAFIRPGAPQPPRLLLAAHHLVCDALSLRILVADLDAAVTGLLCGRQVRLPSGADFAECVCAMHDYAMSDDLAAELDYWLSLPWDQAIELPADAVGLAPDAVRYWATVTETLSCEDTAALAGGHQAPPAAGAILAAASGAVTEWAGGAVGTRILCHGRNLRWAGGTPVLPARAWRTAGYFSTRGAFLLPPRAADQADYVGGITRLWDAAPNQGVGISLLRWSAAKGSQAERLADIWRRSGQMFFNYMGAMRSQAQQSGLVKASTKDLLSPQDLLEPRLPLHVRTAFSAGQLSVMFDYDPVRRREETAARLVRRTADVLRAYAAR
jgi:hypothetical protein